MQRALSGFLAQWNSELTHKPLIIRGARQTGKSFLVRLFAKEQGLRLHEINLEQNRSIASACSRLNAHEILRECEILADCGPIEDGKSLLFLDELQAVPEAIAALRYIYEARPRLSVLAAGSLLEFVLADAEFSMPVGRIEYVFLGPMTFEERLAAAGEDGLLRYLEEFEPGVSPSLAAHEKLLLHMRDYLLCGGMPEAVGAHLERGDFKATRRVHRSILNTYHDDFAKYARQQQLPLLRRVFEYVPRTAGRKMVYSHVDSTHSARDIRSAINLLTLARVIHRVHHTDGTGVPLGATRDDAVFKPLFLDIGLLNATCGVAGLSIDDLLQKRFVHEGAMAEQFVGQHLAFEEDPWEAPELHYWLREGKKDNAEVDFLINVNAHVIPVEVKAGMSGSLRSLHQFVAARGTDLAVRFDLNPPSLQLVEHDVVTGAGTKHVRFRLLSLPLYMIGQTRRIVRACMNRDKASHHTQGSAPLPRTLPAYQQRSHLN